MTVLDLFVSNLQREIGKLEQSLMDVQKEMEKNSFTPNKTNLCLN